jgi:hypothetical protein
MHLPRHRSDWTAKTHTHKSSGEAGSVRSVRSDESGAATPPAVLHRGIEDRLIGRRDGYRCAWRDRRVWRIESARNIAEVAIARATLTRVRERSPALPVHARRSMKAWPQHWNACPLLDRGMATALKCMADALPRHGHSIEMHGDSIEMHGHSIEMHGHSIEMHGHSIEMHGRSSENAWRLLVQGLAAALECMDAAFPGLGRCFSRTPGD